MCKAIKMVKGGERGLKPTRIQNIFDFCCFFFLDFCVIIIIVGDVHKDGRWILIHLKRRELGYKFVIVD